MDRLIILSTPDGGAGKSVEIGDVDATDFDYRERDQAGSGRFGEVGSIELRNVLQKGFNGGYGERPFHVRVGDRVLANCTITRENSCIHFVFDGPADQFDAL